MPGTAPGADNRAMSRLILLPGLASDARMWQDQLAALPETWRPHVTDVHARHAGIQDMAAALLAEHAGDLVLCGASMGGIVAMEVARQAPQRIRGLALLGTNARPETDDVRQLREAAITFFEQGRALEVLRLNVPLAFHSSRVGDTRLTQAYLDFVMDAGAQQLVRQNRAIIGRPDARLHLPALRCPVLVMCGDSDQLTPPECSHEIATLVPHAQLQMVPDCGHMLTMERPEVVNPALLRWLGTLSAARD
jgi:pimeloyl-ACP methyl ester carboxylesterase